MYSLIDLYYIFTLVILQYLLHIILCVLLLPILWRLNKIQSIDILIRDLCIKPNYGNFSFFNSDKINEMVSLLCATCVMLNCRSYIVVMQLLNHNLKIENVWCNALYLLHKYVNSH